MAPDYAWRADAPTPRSRPCPACGMVALVCSPTLHTYDLHDDTYRETTEYQCRGCWRILTVAVAYRGEPPRGD